MIIDTTNMLNTIEVKVVYCAVGIEPTFDTVLTQLPKKAEHYLH